MKFVRTSEAYPLLVGLAVGIAFVLIFAAYESGPATNGVTRTPKVSIVQIAQGAVLQTNPKHFVPETLHVTIGVNNTVKWTNLDSAMSSVVADNNSDPGFFNATNIRCDNNDSQICQILPGKNFLNPGESFEYTFTVPGVFSYHSVPHPWMYGKVIVTTP